jgi:hypothetical protein
MLLATVTSAAKAQSQARMTAAIEINCLAFT